MSHEDIDIVRAWKDEEYRNSLSEEQRAQLPENPAGTRELSDTDLENVAGGKGTDTSEPRGCNTNSNVCITTPHLNGICGGPTKPVT
jgi:mersacidin/lichenicidin family type 2 lantibiotic